MAFNSIITKFGPSKLNLVQLQQIARSSSITAPGMALSKIGKREIVGYGLNGEPSYVDRVDYPMPAIRYKEDTPDIQVLREKEKGDWKKLTVEEKKALYRASFRQTFAEVNAPTGDWKSCTGYTLVFISIGIWMYIFMKFFVYPPMPETFNKDRQKAQLKRLIDLRVNPIDGIASKYDYEKGKWK